MDLNKSSFHIHTDTPLSRRFAILLFLYSGFYMIIKLIQGDFFHNLYLCNACLWIAAYGLYYRKLTYVGISIYISSFAHMTFMYDLVWWFLTGISPIGKIMFIESPDPWWFLTLHHLWFLPAMIWILFKEHKEGPMGITPMYFTWILQTACNAIALWYIREDGYVLSLNTGHELWMDSFNVIHIMDQANIFVFLIWRFLVESILFTGGITFFIKAFLMVILQGSDENKTVKVKQI